MMPWARIAKMTAAGAVVTFGLLSLSAVAAIRQEQRAIAEATRFRWTDKNRWPS